MRNYQKPAVLFFDIDGTIVWRDVEAAKRGEDVPRFDQVSPSPAVCDAFKRLRANGHMPCICTGRSFCQIPQSLRDLNPVGWLVEAGSYVSFDGAVIRDVRIPSDLLYDTALVLQRLEIDAEFESNEGLVGFYPTSTPPRFPEFAVARSIEEFLVYSEEYPLAKFCVHDYSRKDIDGLARFADGRFSMCDLTHDVMEFSMYGCSKGSAIRAVFDYLGCGAEHSFAFGDSENDLPMAEVVESFVALGNALESVKSRASFVTLPVWEDGVPAALEMLGLI